MENRKNDYKHRLKNLKNKFKLGKNPQVKEEPEFVEKESMAAFPNSKSRLMLSKSSPKRLIFGDKDKEKKVKFPQINQKMKLRELVPKSQRAEAFLTTIDTQYNSNQAQSDIDMSSVADSMLRLPVSHMRSQSVVKERPS